jgi:hypothetical protein
MSVNDHAGERQPDVSTTHVLPGMRRASCSGVAVAVITMVLVVLLILQRRPGYGFLAAERSGLVHSASATP